MGFLLGVLLGGFAFGYMFGWLVGRMFYRDTPPDDKALKSGLWAFALVYLLAGWGFARGASINPVVGFLYAPGVILATLSLRSSYRKAWEPDDDTFD